MRWNVVWYWATAVLQVGTALNVVNAADPPNKNLAIIDPAQADEDFAVQGEYWGTVLGGAGWCYQQNIGLQVVALGGGKFDAVEYPCGLPGAGWNGGERKKFHGERGGSDSAAVVELADDSRQIALQNGWATVTTSDGRVLGHLQKVQRVSSTMGAPAPYGAIVLFDGTNTDHFKNAKTTDDGLLTVGTELNQSFRDFRLHLEFRLPYMPHARGQGRANSGVYLQSRYEVQILDSFGLDGKNNECGALYTYQPPAVNMCLPPLAWQTYDIDFTSPRFDESGQKICNARLTVWHNGVAVHNDFEIERKTGAGAKEEPKLLPTKLQNHGNPVHFRNIWLVDRSACAPPAPCAQSQLAGASCDSNCSSAPMVCRPSGKRRLGALFAPFDRRSLVW